MRLTSFSSLIGALTLSVAALGCGSSALTDGQIFGILKTANDGEIKSGQYAQNHAQGQSTKDLATSIVNTDSDANTRQASLETSQGITSATSTDNTTLQSANDSVYTKLVATPDSAFDSEYLTQTSANLQRVLDLLNNDMIPDAHNANLKAELATVKAAVTDQLNQTKALQTN